VPEKEKRKKQVLHDLSLTRDFGEGEINKKKERICERLLESRSTENRSTGKRQFASLDNKLLSEGSRKGNRCGETRTFALSEEEEGTGDGRGWGRLGNRGAKAKGKKDKGKLSVQIR